MRTTKLALLSAALVLPLSLQAQAADAIYEAPPEAPVADIATAPAYLWAGGYAGVFGGYSWGETDAISDVDGAMGGVYGGYNWQSGNFVYGVEADVGYSGAEGTAAGVSAEQGAFGSIRARLGYDMNPFLVYGTVGGAATNLELNSGGASDDQVMYGYTVGAGVETFVTEKITTRLEYRYTDYGSEDFNLGAGTFSTGYDDHSVRAGIGIKF
ncbi:outer membrane protein [Pseudohoeflea coraliihabitans]|uniref:Porin family protein n=1 Tax=Pseudohoeflea coraliihabitans TaxID=2860393 RepID=A0ABS6WRZ0_9HYPH|nr:outer membrane protein [Pseudohoeflea sp. DP4N28-3]MBW3098732.1 porin family protein [Pseudohoeflea sp. DP4N28-3]